MTRILAPSYRDGNQKYLARRRASTATIPDVARKLKFDCHAVKALEMQYIRAALALRAW
jgi:hypothetical protein